jgi:hypothetical protein
MFNQTIKERFLNSYIDSTARMYRYVLEKAEQIETQLNKDICNFSTEERDMLLYSYSNRSRAAVDVVKSSLNKYVEWCIEEGLVSDRINYFATIGGNDLDKYIDKSALEHKYITYKQLLDMTNFCINLQDIVPLFLAFSGVLGETASEIIELEVSNLQDGKIILKDREVELDSRIYDLIEDAIQDKVYYIGNGETTAIAQSRVINPTPWVLRSAGETKLGKMIYSSVLQRVGRVKEYFGNPYLTLKNVWFSGMIHDLKAIKEVKGELGNEDWEKVAIKFGYNPEGIIQLRYKIGEFI